MTYLTHRAGMDVLAIKAATPMASLGLAVKCPLNRVVYDRGRSETLGRKKSRSRQLKDLPRISMAEPLAGFIDDFMLAR